MLFNNKYLVPVNIDNFRLVLSQDNENGPILDHEISQDFIYMNS